MSRSRWLVAAAGGMLVLALVIGGTVAAQGTMTSPAAPPDGDVQPWCGTCGTGGRALAGDWFGSRHGGMMGWGRTFAGDVLAAIAEEAGLGVDALRDELGEGRTVAEILEEYDVTVEAVVARVIEERQAILDEAVAFGRIDAAQAERMLDHMEEEVTEHLEEGELLCGIDQGHTGRSAAHGSRQPFGRGRMAAHR